MFDTKLQIKTGLTIQMVSPANYKTAGVEIQVYGHRIVIDDGYSMQLISDYFSAAADMFIAEKK